MYCSKCIAKPTVMPVYMCHDVGIKDVICSCFSSWALRKELHRSYSRHKEKYPCGILPNIPFLLQYSIANKQKCTCFKKQCFSDSVEYSK